MEKFLLESPKIIPNEDPRYNHLNDRELNAEFGEYYFNNFQPVSTFVFGNNLTWSVFKDGCRYFVASNATKASYFIGAKLSGQEIDDNGFRFTEAWNSSNTPSLARETIFKYFLNVYNFIQSDNLHTPYGKEYWKKILTEGLKRKKRCTVVTFLKNNIDSEVEISDTSNIDKYWEDNNSRNIVFRVYS